MLWKSNNSRLHRQWQGQGTRLKVKRSVVVLPYEALGLEDRHSRQLGSLGNPQRHSLCSRTKFGMLEKVRVGRPSVAGVGVAVLMLVWLVLKFDGPRLD